jgi:hypothetical protein
MNASQSLASLQEIASYLEVLAAEFPNAAANISVGARVWGCYKAPASNSGPNRKVPGVDWVVKIENRYLDEVQSELVVAEVSVKFGNSGESGYLICKSPEEMMVALRTFFGMLLPNVDG